MRKVIIIGGGPSGSLTGIMLKKEALSAGMDIDVVILESKPFRKAGAIGCNYCAGVITARTLKRIQDLDLSLAEDIFQRRIDGFFYVTEGGAEDFTRDHRPPIYTVFRGGGPKNRQNNFERSFDRQLLKAARNLGVEIKQKHALAVKKDGTNAISVLTRDGERLDADVVIGAFGVNSPISRTLAKTIGYRPPEAVSACQAEIRLDDSKIDEIYGNRIMAFVLKDKNIRFMAVTPKKNYLTLTAIGKGVTIEHLKAYLHRPEVERYISRDDADTLIGCHCYPQLPIGLAKGAISDRFLCVGDAIASRFYKNGLGSAFFTARTAAQTIVHHGVMEKDLIDTYGKEIRKRFAFSNQCGKVLFSLNDLAYKTKWLAKANLGYITHEREKKVVTPLNNLMWSLFTGDKSYSLLLRKALNPLLLIRMLFWYLKFTVAGIGNWINKAITVR